jgi:hypothetical protein
MAKKSDTQVLDENATDEQGSNGHTPVEVSPEVAQAPTEVIVSQIEQMRAAAKARKAEQAAEKARLTELRTELKARKGDSPRGGASTDPGIWVTYAAARIVRTLTQQGKSMDEALEAVFASLRSNIVGTLEYSASHDNMDLKLASRAYVRDDKPQA